MTDPGGGERVSGRGRLPRITENYRSWPGRCLGRRNPIVPDSPIGMGGGSPPQCPELGDLGGGCGLPVAIVGLQRN